MRLIAARYSEHEGTPEEWVLEGIELGQRNLLVGRNATGKTRVLNVLNALAFYLAGLRPPGLSSKYRCTFAHMGSNYEYVLEIHDEQVIRETFTVNNDILLDRNEGGQGTIFAEEQGRRVRFQTPAKQVAAFARRDSLQHSFLEPLYDWASSVRHHQFGSTLGKDHISILSASTASNVDDRDQSKVIGLFKMASKTWDEAFKRAIIDDLARINYHIEEIGIGAPSSIRIAGDAPLIAALYVKEKDLPGITDQISMSQGMYRVISLLILTNYLQSKGTEGCLLVDDIGEGLDFERSCSLIELLREKSKKTNLQLIMSSNDRFVMNNVPLDEWSVLQRRGNHVRVLNNSNSAQAFEDFRFTGMSNSSMIELGFLDNTETPDA